MSVDSATKMTMEAIKANIKAKIPIMLVGAPGTGKTEAIRELAKKMGYELITVIGSQMDPTDISGLPKGEKVIEQEDGTAVWGTVYLAPWWQIRILEKKKVILFLDEFSNTSSSTRAAMLVMLQNREFPNGTVMPDETIVIGAMNPVSQAADGYELDLPTTNRIFFIPWDPSLKSWTEGMLNGWGKKISDEELLWKQRIVRFINDNPTWLHREPEEVDTVQAYGVNPNNPSQMEVFRSAWASRRTWDKLSQALAYAPNDVSIQDMIAGGLVGTPATMAFRAWLRSNEVIDPKDVLKDPSKINWKKISLGDSNLLLRALIEMISPETGEQTIEVFKEIAKQERTDLGAPYMRDFMVKLTNKGVFTESEIKKNKKLLIPLIQMYKTVSDNSR